MSRQTFKTSQGLCLMRTLSLLQAHRVNVLPWPSKSPDLNPIKHNWDTIGRVVRRWGIANIRQFTRTAICNGRMERNYTSHAAVCEIDAQSLPERHRSEWRSYQV